MTIIGFELQVPQPALLQPRVPGEALARPQGAVRQHPEDEAAGRAGKAAAQDPGNPGILLLNAKKRLSAGNRLLIQFRRDCPQCNHYAKFMGHLMKGGRGKESTNPSHSPAPCRKDGMNSLRL